MLIIRNIILMFLLGFPSILLTAQPPTRYLVSFTDKNNSPFSLTQPEAYLSQRALARRLRQHIQLQENDLPVNPSYIDGIRATGAQVLCLSKWLNSVVIYVGDTSILQQIRVLPYVKEVNYVAMKKKPGNGSTDPVDKWVEFNKLNDSRQNTPLSNPLKSATSGVFDYGPSASQVQMLHCDRLHELGFRGQGMVIAVLDAGFYQADQAACFDSLRGQGRILGTRDFVNPGGNVYLQSSHGMNVLSVMAGLVPGEIIGTAPSASYWLLRSEDQGSESPVEEEFWVSAAEFADSVGVDIINSSLGYSEFDDPSLSHSPDEMDGNTTHCTIGADIAASKGILVVNSAGNLGGSFWQIISAPADGDSVLAVGAVDQNGFYAFFSSTGPSADGRIKPDVAGQGLGTILYSSAGAIFAGNGTSFSSPLIAGAAACLWQAHPNVSNMEILRAIQSSASRYNDPDFYIGYGIPDFAAADKKLYPPFVNPSGSDVIIYPNPGRSSASINLYLDDYQSISINFYDNTGRKVSAGFSGQGHPGVNKVKLGDTETLPEGIYLVRVQTGTKYYQSKWLKM